MVMITLYSDFNSIKEKISRHFGCHRQDREHHFSSYAYAGHTGLTPGSGRCHGEGNGNPPQDSFLGNLMDREAWQA